MREQIENNFKYHAPKEKQIDKYNLLRDYAKDYAYIINDSCPNSREKSLALTKLEESVMWANASIARNKEEEVNSLIIGEIKKEIIVGASKFKAENKLQEIVESLGNDEFLLEKKSDYIKTDKRIIRVLSCNSYNKGQRASTVYADSELTIRYIEKIIKPMLAESNGRVIYF